MNLDAIVFVAAGLGIAGAFMRSKFPRNTTTNAPMAPARIDDRAPEIRSDVWFNYVPPSISRLRGRVVVMQFWRFGCAHCRSAASHLNRWHKAASRKKLEVIGVHTPKSKQEKDLSNVLLETRKLGIDYPVVIDNENYTWDSFGRPDHSTFCVIDKAGALRYVSNRALDYNETERLITNLVLEKKSPSSTRRTLVCRPKSVYS